MTNNFNDLFSEMLMAFKDGKSVEEIIAAQTKKEGLNEKQVAEVLETDSCSKDLDDAYKSLLAAKAEGDSREDWLNEEFEEISSSLDADEKNILLEGLKKAQENIIEITE